MANICLPTYLQNISYTRVPVGYTQHRDVLLGRGPSEALQSESCGLATRRLFSMDFLPVMASNSSSMTYKLELLNNHRVHNLLAMCSINQAFERIDNGGGQIFTLLNAHHLIGAYFLATESKCMRLLTRLYS